MDERTASAFDVTAGPGGSRGLVRKRGRPDTSLSIIVSTYEWPEALDCVLRGLAAQSDPAFDIVIADDGSTASTGMIVERWQGVLGERLVHAWQPDDGFRLARVRNLGAATARGSHLVFIDGDCIPRRHFVHAIRRALLPGWFLATTRLQLSERLSRSVLRARTPVERWGAMKLLVRARGDVRGWRHLTPRDRRRSWKPGLPDFWPHGNSYGFCTGVARADFDAVNGFDTRFVGWGDQDVDLAVRLRRIALRCGYAGPRSAMLHLWHPSRMTKERSTWWLLQETVESDRIEAVEGVRELACEIA